jgi:hypothetical protein
MSRPISPGYPIAVYSADSITPGDLTYNSTALTVIGNSGTNTLVFSASTGLQVGMFVRINNALTGETFSITNLVGTTATLSGNLLNTYASASVFFGCVGTIKDLSGNGNHLVQSTGSQQPLLISNYNRGHNALFFDGINDRFEVGFNLCQPYTVYMIVTANVGASQFLFDGFNQQCFARLDNSMVTLQLNAGGSSSVRVDASLTNNNRFIVACFNTQGTVGYLNDRTEIGNAGTNNPNGFILFSRCPPNATNVAAGYFTHAEIYANFHSTAITTLVRTKLQNQYAA